MVSGKLYLVTREEIKKVANSNFDHVRFVGDVLNLLYRPSIICILSYILINSKSNFFKNCEGKFVKGLEIRHSTFLQENYIWFIHKNEDEVSLEKEQ